MQDLLTGLAFFLIIEGLIYAVFPGGVKKMAAMADQLSESSLRTSGVVVLAIGVASVWLIRG